MKPNKTILIAFLLIVVFTLGAVSASHDIDGAGNLTTDDGEFEIEPAESDGDWQDETDEDITPDGFDVDYAKSAILHSESSVISIYNYDENEGNITVSIDDNENPAYNRQADEYTSIHLSDLGINATGKYGININFVDKTGNKLTLADYMLTVRQLGKADFEVYFTSDLPIMETGAVHIENFYGICGNLTASVNGSEMFECEFDEYYSTITLDDLKINTTGTYGIVVNFISKSGERVTLVNDILTVRQLSSDDFDISCNDEMPLNSLSTFIFISSDYDLKGDLTVAVNGNKRYLSEFENNIHSIRLNDLKINTTGTYNIQINFTSQSTTTELFSGNLTVRKATSDDFEIDFDNDTPLNSEKDIIRIENYYNIYGNVIVSVNGIETYSSEFDYDTCGITLEGLKISSEGKYDVQVRFAAASGDEIMLLNDTLTVRNLTKDDFNVDFKENVPLCYDLGIIIITSPNYPTGSIIVSVNGSEVYSSEFDGYEGIYLSTLEISETGTYDILVEFSEESGHAVTLVNATLTVRQLTPDDFNVECADSIPIKSRKCVIRIDDGESYYLSGGALTAYVDGNEITLDEEEMVGYPYLYLEDLKIDSLGPHSIVVKFSQHVGDGVTLANYTLNITPEGKFTKDDFEVYFNKMIPVDSDNEIIYVYNDLAGYNLTVSVDGKTVYNREFKYDDISLCLDDIEISEPGEYDIVVSYISEFADRMILIDDTLNVTGKEGVDGMEVSIARVISYTADDEWEEEDDYHFIRVYTRLDGNILVYFDGEVYYNETISDYRTYIDVEQLKSKPTIGEHIVQVKYENGNDITVAKSKVVDVTGEIIIDEYGNTENGKAFEIRLPCDADGDLYAVFEGGEEKIPYENGYANYTVFTDSLDLNRKYTLRIELRNDSFYPTTQDQHDFEIIPEITYPSYYMSPDETQLLTVRVPVKCGGTLYLYNAIYLGKGEYEKNGSAIASADIVNGSASITLSGLGYGEHNFIAEYVNGAYVYGKDNWTTFDVLVHDNTEGISAVVNSTAADAGDSIELNITTAKKLKGSFQIYLDGRNIDEIEVKSGKTATAIIQIASGGQHILKVYYTEYSSDGNFYGNTFFINKATTIPEIDIPSLDNVSINKTITVTLPKDATGNVTLTVDGKDYVFPVVNGVANVKIPALANGGHDYNITYSGDAKYSEFTKTGRMTVNQTAAPKADVIKLTLKTVKVKKYAKKLVLQATLKVNGKAVKGKKVTFKFNGKTYKATTNKKGIAKVTIKSKVLKKLKVGKKVKYQATYMKTTVKKTAKVKR